MSRRQKTNNHLLNNVYERKKIQENLLKHFSAKNANYASLTFEHIQSFDVDAAFSILFFIIVNYFNVPVKSAFNFSAMEK